MLLSSFKVAKRKQKQKYTEVHLKYLEIAHICRYISIAINDTTVHPLVSELERRMQRICNRRRHLEKYTKSQANFRSIQRSVLLTNFGCDDFED